MRRQPAGITHERSARARRWCTEIGAPDKGDETGALQGAVEEQSTKLSVCYYWPQKAQK